MKTPPKRTKRQRNAEVETSAPVIATAPPAPAATPEWRRHMVPLLLLWAGIVLAYSSSFQAGLVMDNKTAILEDPRLTAATSENVHLILEKEYWYLNPGNGLYRPVTTLSYLLNYSILGNRERPTGYHIFNLLLHGLNASLVYAIGLLLFSEMAPALALAGLWALHPILTESVTNVVGRADLLAGLAVLAGLFCYIRGSSPGARRLLWLAGAVMALAVGMFSKESAIVLLPLVVIYDAVYGAAGWWRSRIAVYGALAIPCLVFLAVRYQVLAGGPATHFPYVDNPIAGAGFLSAKLTAIKVVGKAMWLLVWPAHLSSDYSYNQIPLFGGQFNWEDWKALLSLLVCVLALLVAVWAYRRNRPLAFFIAFFFAAMAPTANLFLAIGSIFAERFLYLPAIGFAACVTMAVYRLLPGRAAMAILAVIALAFAGRTFARNFDWKTEQSVWASARVGSPNSYKVHVPAALDDRDRAVAEIDRALGILQTLPEAVNPPGPYVNGGQIYRLKGDQVAGSNPAAAHAWYEKAVATLQHAEHLEAVTGMSGRYQLYQEMGTAYLRLADYPKAAAAFDRACRRSLTPRHYEQLAVAYLKMPDLHKAALSLLEGWLVDTSNRKVGSELADVYSQLDPDGCSRTVSLQCPAVHADYCTASKSLAAKLAEAGFPAQSLQTSRAAASQGCL